VWKSNWNQGMGTKLMIRIEQLFEGGANIYPSHRDFTIMNEENNSLWIDGINTLSEAGWYKVTL